MNLLIKLIFFYKDEVSSQQKNNSNSKNNLRVETVNTTKDFKKFYRFPFKLYKDNPNWVAPFWIEYKDFFNEKNPFWKHAKAELFIAYKNDEIVGRIAAIVDDLYCDISKEKIGFFGFFESIEDFNCAEALLQSAQDWLISKEMSMMRGPIDGRVDIGCGFLKNNFNQI